MGIPGATTLTPTDPTSEAEHWLAFKQAWDSGELQLDQATRSYFQKLARRHFARALSTDRGIGSFGYTCPSTDEIWALTCTELHLKRANSGCHLLDDMFLRAFHRARQNTTNPDTASLVGYLKKQFELRIRDVVRTWVREHFGSHGKRIATDSIDACSQPRENVRGPDSRHALIAIQDPDGVQDAEWRDLQTQGMKLAKQWFEQAPPTTRACVVLKAARISLSLPQITRTLAMSKSFLFKVERQAREQAVTLAREFDPHLDPNGVKILATAVYTSMRDRCESWFLAEKSLAPLFSLVR